MLVCCATRSVLRHGAMLRTRWDGGSGVPERDRYRCNDGETETERGGRCKLRMSETTGKLRGSVYVYWSPVYILSEV